jgi:hypothetical protein
MGTKLTGATTGNTPTPGFGGFKSKIDAMEALAHPSGRSSIMFVFIA